MSLMSTCLFASFSRDIETGSTTVRGCVDGYEGTISALALTSFGSDEHSTRCLAEKRKSTTTAVSCAHSLHLHLPLKEGNAHTSCPWVSRQGCAIFCWDIGPEKGHQSGGNVTSYIWQWKDATIVDFFFLLSFVLNNVITEGCTEHSDSSEHCSHAQLCSMYSIFQMQSLCLQL